ncbi:MAG: hypothetical protein HY328_07135 [Chloroflexi bacterium]|nr:hypothetical protein [Chloroflexota bacterium]
MRYLFLSLILLLTACTALPPASPPTPVPTPTPDFDDPIAGGCASCAGSTTRNTAYCKNRPTSASTATT